MSTVLAKLKVADFATWKVEFDKLAPLRKDHGWSAHTIYHDPSDPSVVIVVSEVTSADRAAAYFASDPVRQGVLRAGVQGPPEVSYLTQAEAFEY